MAHTAHTAHVAALLGRTDLFRLLDDADRLAVAEQMRESAFEPGKQIFARGDKGRDIHLVLEGRVRLSVLAGDGRVLSFKHAGAGDIFGEIASLDEGDRSADATALTRVRTMRLARAPLMRLVETRPVVAKSAIAFLCGRLRATSEQVEDIALHSIEVRLARFLLSAVRLSRGGQPASGWVELDIAMSQAELALLLGASRQKVNAALSVLEEEGAVKRVPGHLECNIEALHLLAHSQTKRWPPRRSRRQHLTASI